MRIERNVLVPLADGVHLAADLYLPDDAGPHPALISYYPYHKDDLIGALFEWARSYFAQQGYACLLVDFRGTGGSEGTCTDTFDTAQEGSDGAEVVEWSAHQPWCDGAVGVWGMSYGAIMSLAIAAQRPPHLKAIVPIYGSENIWADFVAPGGCPNCLGNYARESFMLAMDLSPPMLEDADGRWMRVWKEQLERFAVGALHSLNWQERRDYDDHWRVREIQLERIEVPAFLIGGWRDIFAEATVRIFARLNVPKRMLIGPWLHTLPDWSPYEPVDWLYYTKRWWDRWLKQEDNGVDADPAVTVFIQGSERWKHEHEWPLTRTEERTLYLDAQETLVTTPGHVGNDLYETDPTVGTAAGLWDPLGIGIGYPLAQTDDDLRSRTYTSDPLVQDTEITGSPKVRVQVALERGEQLHLTAKLCAVAQDGSSILLSSGWLNAAHHEGHERSTSVPQGQVISYAIPMCATSYFVPQGSRLRLSLACGDFPRIWPTQSNPFVRFIYGGDANTASCVRVPVVPSTDEPPEAPVIVRPDLSVNRSPWITFAEPRWEIKRDLVDGSAAVSCGSTLTLQLPTGGSVTFRHDAIATVTPRRPDAAAVHAKADMDIRMPAGEHVIVRTRSRFTRETMHLEGCVTIDNVVLFEGRWGN